MPSTNVQIFSVNVYCTSRSREIYIFGPDATGCLSLGCSYGAQAVRRFGVKQIVRPSQKIEIATLQYKTDTLVLEGIGSELVCL